MTHGCSSCFLASIGKRERIKIHFSLDQSPPDIQPCTTTNLFVYPKNEKLTIAINGDGVNDEIDYRIDKYLIYEPTELPLSHGSVSIEQVQMMSKHSCRKINRNPLIFIYREGF